MISYIKGQIVIENLRTGLQHHNYESIHEPKSSKKISLLKSIVYSDYQVQGYLSCMLTQGLRDKSSK